MKKIYTLIAMVLCVGGLSAQVTENFEGMTVGTQINSLGWGSQEATIADDPISSGNNVVKMVPADYNSGPVVEFTLPAGATLANYNSFKFDAYFDQGDVGWKDVVVEAYSSAPTGGAYDDNGIIIGLWNRAEGGSTAWEAMDIPINQNDTYAQTLSGTVYIVFGINCAGTGDIGGALSETIWYADNVTLSPDLSTTAKAPKAEAKISTDPGTINVAPQVGSNVEIYSLSGAKVFSQDNAGGTVSVNVAPGLYIVVVDNISTKVIVK
jgi:hypothetical protein